MEAAELPRDQISPAEIEDEFLREAGLHRLLVNWTQDDRYTERLAEFYQAANVSVELGIAQTTVVLDIPGLEEEYRFIYDPTEGTLSDDTQQRSTNGDKLLRSEVLVRRLPNEMAEALQTLTKDKMRLISKRLGYTIY